MAFKIQNVILRVNKEEGSPVTEMFMHVEASNSEEAISTKHIGYIYWTDELDIKSGYYNIIFQESNPKETTEQTTVDSKG